MLPLAIYTFIWSCFLLSWIHYNLFIFYIEIRPFELNRTYAQVKMHTSNVSISGGEYSIYTKPKYSFSFYWNQVEPIWVDDGYEPCLLHTRISQMEQATLQIHGNYFQLHFRRNASYMYNANELGHRCKIAYGGSLSLLLEAPQMAYSKSGLLLCSEGNVFYD